MKINAMTLLLIALAAVLATVVLGSKVFMFLALAACAAVVCFALWAIRLHRMMEGSDDDVEGR